jgi:hypothetical protein
MLIKDTAKELSNIQPRLDFGSCAILQKDDHCASVMKEEMFYGIDTRKSSLLGSVRLAKRFSIWKGLGTVRPDVLPNKWQGSDILGHFPQRQQ